MNPRKSRLNKRFPLIPLVFIVMLAIGIATNASAEKIIVDTTQDQVDADLAGCTGIEIGDLPGADEKISLREAVCAANNNPGADTIELGSGTYTLTSAGTGEDANCTGDLDIIGDLTITGQGATKTIIDGNKTDRVFDIDPTGFGSFTVQIGNLTIQNGSAGSSDGAGIRASGNDDTVQVGSCTISGNDADNYGGGVYCAGTCTINNSTIATNSADNGGGIYNTGAVTITNSNIETNNAGNFGAGIFSIGPVSIDDSTITGNQALSVAGGICLYIDNGTTVSTTLTDTSVSSNNSVNAHCGGIYV
jgi:predicted outer membrane repeat protein